MVLIVVVLAQVFYIKVFPRISRVLGYGSVEDVVKEAKQKTKISSIVTVYTAIVCPFCPIVMQRLLS